MAIIYLTNPWQSFIKSSWKLILFHHDNYLSYVVLFISLTFEAHGHYLYQSPWKILFIKDHEKSLFKNPWKILMVT